MISELKWTVLLLVPGEAHVWGDSAPLKALRQSVLKATTTMKLAPLRPDDAFALVLGECGVFCLFCAVFFYECFFFLLISLVFSPSPSS